MRLHSGGGGGGAKGSSPLGKRSPVLKTVKTTSTEMTRTERAERKSMRASATPPFTSCSYSVAARASIVKGNEYDHHARLNRRIALRNSAGLDTCQLIDLIGGI